MPDTVVHFHALSYVPDGDDVVVGRIETGSFAVLPADGAQLLRRLAGGQPTLEAAAWYEESFGEPVDMDDFLESMDGLGFIRPPGTQPEAVSPPRFQWLGRMLFSAPAWFVYAALAIAAFVEVAGSRVLRPTASQVYFTSSLATVEIVVMFGQTPLAFLHEAYHVLAGQRIGLRSKLGISNRYTYVVFETRSNGLLGVPRSRRYLPFLAGMLLDVEVICVLDLVAAATRESDGAVSIAGRICLAFSFSVIGRLGWQFLVYLRSDVYYVLATALNCYDLHEASKAIFFNRLRRLFRRTGHLVDENQWTARDRKVGAWYGWCLLLGMLATVFLTAFVSGPILFIYVERAAHGLAAGAGAWRFWDSLASLFLIVFQFALPALLAWRKRRNQGERNRIYSPRDREGAL
jgi:hypothetical protein